MPAAAVVPLVTAGVSAGAATYSAYEGKRTRQRAEGAFEIEQKRLAKEEAKLEALAKGQRTAAMEERLRALRAARGRRTRTLLTGGAGLADEASITQKRLLGE